MTCASFWLVIGHGLKYIGHRQISELSLLQAPSPCTLPRCRLVPDFPLSFMFYHSSQPLPPLTCCGDILLSKQGPRGLSACIRAQIVVEIPPFSIHVASDLLPKCQQWLPHHTQMPLQGQVTSVSHSQTFSSVMAALHPV